MFRPVLQVRRFGSVDGDFTIAIWRMDDERPFGGGSYGCSFRVVRSHNVNFAVKCIAERISLLSAGDVEQKAAIFANRSVGIGNANTILPSHFAFLGPGIDFGN